MFKEQQGSYWLVFLVEVQRARGRVVGDEDGEEVRKQMTWVVKDLVRSVVFIKMKSFCLDKHCGPSGQPTSHSTLPTERLFLLFTESSYKSSSIGDCLCSLCF